MSARPLVLALACTACTRLNPAFETGSDESLGETNDEVGDASTEVGTDSDTGVDPTCEMEPGQSLSIVLTEPCGETNDIRYRRGFSVIESTGSGWLGFACGIDDFACVDCPDDIPSEIFIGPIDTTGLAGAGACLRVEAEQRDPSLNSCSFDSIAVWNGTTPILVASNGTALVGEGLLDAGGIQPLVNLVEDPPCDCVEDCCQPPAGPGDFEFLIGNQSIFVGEAQQLEGRPYVFHALKARNPTGCTADLEQVWALTHSP